MLHKINLRLTPQQAAAPEDKLRLVAAEALKINPHRIVYVRIIRRSIDARQRKVMVNLTLEVHVDRKEDTAYKAEPLKPVTENAPECIIVGAGPAGLFAAIELIRKGVKPIILERGKDVDSRRKDMAKISREGIVDEDSNYCFGEGGAGAFSDGKLYTRSKKRGNVEDVLRILHTYGAQESILIDAHPHIGTDRLPGVIKAIREAIIAAGGRVQFNTRVTELVIENNEVKGVKCLNGEIFHGPVILATGHSARDIYRMLAEKRVEMQPKGLAVGVRLEHPQELVDRLQYHSSNGRGKYLPAAEYSMLTRVDDRAVYSFCMCPGGFIIPAASAPGQLVVNGMSPSNRGTRWANSGMVVEILPDDVPDKINESHPELKMMSFQENIEKIFAAAAGGTQKAPAQRMTDFVIGTASRSLPESSYAPGIFPARIDMLLPEGVAQRLRRGFMEFNRKQPGFLTSDAVLIGDETRTSAPVQIVRNAENLQHIRIKGLYPCGEGAGYAGGIVSAAIDGMRCADAAAEMLTGSN
ncbi:MAG: FAD-binding protein [Muribaculaceae bacterium]|nr:FAD-binding protein [Muribaculaceae bacterium]